MYNNQLHAPCVKYIHVLLGAAIFTILLAVSCKKAPVAVENFESAGTIQGSVIDKATGDAIPDVGVTLLYRKEDENGNLQDSAKFIKTTDMEGRFTFKDLPVNADAKGTENGIDYKGQPYTIRLDASQAAGYRNTYLMNVNVVFESTGGDGAATGLTSNIMIPLSKQSVTVKGKLLSADANNKPLEGVNVDLYQEFNPVINGNPTTSTELYLASATSAGDGTFSFSDVEEDASIFFRFFRDEDPAEVIDEERGFFTTPSSDGSSTPALDVGTQRLFSQDNTEVFYITSITPEQDADMDPANIKFVYVFNKPVKQTPYTRTDLGFGNGTMLDDIGILSGGKKKATSGDIDFTVQWSANFDSLTIIPSLDELEDARFYTLSLNASFPSVLNELTDANDNHISFGGDLPYQQFEAEVRDFSTNANNAKPHTPVLAMDSTSNTIDYNSGTVDISFEVDESTVDVKEYEMWGKFGDESYEMLFTISRSDITFNKYEEVYDGVGYFSPLIILRGPGNDTPEEAIANKIKVRAISPNLREGAFSNELTFSDIIKPDLVSASYDGGAGELTVVFEEPMNKAQVETASNYSFEDGAGNAITGVNIESIVYTADYGFNPASEQYQVIITLQDPADLNSAAGERVIVATGVTDLDGNGMDTATTDPDNDDDGQTNEATY